MFYHRICTKKNFEKVWQNIEKQFANEYYVNPAWVRETSIFFDDVKRYCWWKINNKQAQVYTKDIFKEILARKKIFGKRNAKWYSRSMHEQNCFFTSTQIYCAKKKNKYCCITNFFRVSIITILINDYLFSIQMIMLSILFLNKR